MFVDESNQEENPHKRGWEPPEASCSRGRDKTGLLQQQKAVWCTGLQTPGRRRGREEEENKASTFSVSWEESISAYEISVCSLTFH